MRISLFTLLIALFLAAPLAAKDKSVANDYKIILQVNEEGKVIRVKTENTMPNKLKEKTLDAFLNKELGKKIKDGKPIAYDQKIVISTKFLIGDSRVSKR